MKSNIELKDLVKEKYSEIALQSRESNISSCCGSGSCTTEVYNIMTDDYTEVGGYNPEADLGLGCGLPTEFAKIKPGDTVIDLGSGAGNDCFVARSEAGETGRIIGVDFTPAMIAQAKTNAEKLAYTNVEFIEADIENIPLEDHVADVVISNCVLNLVPGKEGVVKEIFRLLKPGGHFSISDIVLEGELPENISKAAEIYAGCVSGAIQKDQYLSIIDTAGFTNVTVQKEKRIVIPHDILANYLNTAAITEFENSSGGIFSVTVYAEKPITNE